MLERFAKQQSHLLMEVEEEERRVFDHELTKLPLFGQQLAPNFESPTQEEFASAEYQLSSSNNPNALRLCEIAFKRRAVGNEL